jgi:hypothetical protein
MVRTYYVPTAHNVLAPCVTLDDVLYVDGIFVVVVVLEAVDAHVLRASSTGSIFVV